MSKNSERGQSLFEILIAIAILGVVLSTISSLVYVGLLTGRTSRENSFVQTQIQDMSSAVRGLAAIDWRALWGSTGLVSVWGMNEGTGIRLYDPVGGNNGTLVNNPTWQSAANCKFGQCLSFDGVSQYVDIGNSASLQITGDQTIALWLYPTDFSARRNPYAKAYGGEGTITQEIDGAVSYYYGTCGGNCAPYQGFSSPAGTLATSTWTHIAIVRCLSCSPMTLTWYKNGSFLASTTASYSTAAVSSLPAYIARGYVSNFAGRIDDVRIYNRALSATEIQTLYSKPGGLYPRNVGGFWTVKEGADTIQSSLFGNFIRWYEIGSVNRDTSGNIVSSGGTPDPSTIKINYYVITPRGRTVSFSEYVTRSESRVTLQTDWSGGPNASGVYTSATNVFATSTNIDSTSTPGQITLMSGMTSGMLESAVYDSQKVGGVAYNFLMWMGIRPPTTTVEFQLASSNSPSGPWTFVGPDCQSGTRYSGINGVLPSTQEKITAACHTGHRYFRYKIYLNGTTTSTPTVTDVFIGWSP
jgi:type II secretory pathway pseudopilin PulG